MGIITTIPTNLDFPNRGVLERDAFVNAQETAQDLLAGAYTTALNQYATELNSTQADINLKAEQVANQAVDGGYSQTYINTTFTPKILNTQTDKATPVDADLIPLSDSASSFGLKKLSWANLKAILISSFGVLISGLTAKATPVDADMIIIADSAGTNASKKVTFANLKAMIFTNSALTGTPTAPTQTAQDNSTKVATTAYVDGKMVRGTAVNSTSGTAIDFTGIPSWSKRITVMLNGVSLSGASSFLIQCGTGSIQTTGYASSGTYTGIGSGGSTSTAGFVIWNGAANESRSGAISIFNIANNKYVASGIIGYDTGGAYTTQTGGSVVLSGVLDRIRITTVNGTDTFDAGSINIIYEG